jgi:hypothetical protein
MHSLNEMLETPLAFAHGRRSSLLPLSVCGISLISTEPSLGHRLNLRCGHFAFNCLGSLINLCPSFLGSASSGPDTDMTCAVRVLMIINAYFVNSLIH